MKNRHYPIKTIVLVGIALALLYVSTDWVRSGGLTAAAQRKPVPGFTVSDLNGQSWDLAEHRGKVVLVNFWATWCPPCRSETPGLVRLANSYRGKGLDVIGISMDEGDPETVRKFVADYGIPYPVAQPGEHSALGAAVESLPTTLLIDKQGKLAKAYSGAASESTFRKDVETLLSQKGEGD